MTRLTKKFGDKVLLPIIPMSIEFTEDLKNYHNVRRDIEEKVMKLAEYEDLEEQGLIVRLPFKIGDIVFVVDNSSIGEGFAEDYIVVEGCIDRIFLDDFIDEKGITTNMAEIKYDGKETPYTATEMYFTDLDVTVFLDRESAEKGLEKIKKYDKE